MDRYRDFFTDGRITRENLLGVLNGEQALAPGETLFETDTGPVSRRDIYLAALVHPLKGVTGCQLNWQVEELNALASFQEDVAESSRKRLLSAAGSDQATAVTDLWNACLEVLDLEYVLLHPEELLDLSPEQAENMLAHLEPEADRLETETLIQRRPKRSAREKINLLLDRVGSDLTLRGLLLALTSKDLIR
ncbi:MAG: hypothetical protein U9Q81_21255 [Pseudomonadota bacterium]|nr:hypothetical protein [Pseudomonadota bacterium]